MSPTKQQEVAEQVAALRNHADALTAMGWRGVPNTLRVAADSLERMSDALREMYDAAHSGHFYDDYDEATARCARARAALGEPQS